MKNKKLILKELFSNDEVSGEWGEELPSETHLLRVRCIRGADIEEAYLNKLHSAPTRYIKNKSISKLLKENDIILEISGGSPTQSTGRAVIITRQLLQQAKDPIVCSNFCRTLRVKNQNDPKFVFYSLQNIYKQGVFFNFEGKTTGIKNLDLKSALKSIPIIYLDFPTQQKIAAVLTALDAKIELNQRINAELESMAMTLYDYWFVQFDFPNEKGKPYQSAGGKMVWNEALKREIPLGWGKGVLSDIGTITGGSTPSREIEDYFDVNGTAWITPKDLSLNTGNKFITKGEIDVSEKGLKAASLNIMPKGTVLLSSRAPIGYMAIAREEVTTNQGFKSFVADKEYSSHYIYYTVKNAIPTIVNHSSGSTFKEVSGSVLKEIYICLPPVSITEKYKETVDAIFERQNKLELESQTLTELRDWLLPMLMNGQVRVMG